MAVSPSFKTFVLEQLGRGIQGIRGRSMFGGVGMIDDDILYFKVDDSNRRAYEARGMDPFRPYGETGETMQYYRVPEDLLEDVEALSEWAEQAIAVARRARRTK